MFMILLNLWLPQLSSAATYEQFLLAIRIVESSDGAQQWGDNGISRGPYQISNAYWIDSKVPGKWADCDNRAYSEQVVKAYWQRYCPKPLATGQWEILARIHNGGPTGYKKKSTESYWAKVKATLRDIERGKVIDWSKIPRKKVGD